MRGGARIDPGWSSLARGVVCAGLLLAVAASSSFAATACPTERRELAGQSTAFLKRLVRTEWKKSASKYSYDGSEAAAYAAACNVKQGGSKQETLAGGYDWRNEQLWAVSRSGHVWEARLYRLELSLGIEPAWFSGYDCIAAEATWRMRVLRADGGVEWLDLSESLDPSMESREFVMKRTIEQDGQWPGWSPILYSAGASLEMNPPGGGAFVNGLVRVADAGPDAKSTDKNAEEADPVNAIDGNVLTSDTDATVPAAGIPLNVTRYYNSVVGEDTGFGPGWTHSYSASLTDSSTVFRGVRTDWKVFTAVDGAVISFENHGDGTFSSPYDMQAALVSTNGGYRVTFGGGLCYDFSAAGALQAITDTWGRSVRLSYLNALLQRVVHDSGRELHFGHLGDRIASVSLQDGTCLARYRYDTDQRLAGVESYGYGDTQQVTYAYAPQSHSLTQKVSRSGVPVAWVYATNALGQVSGKAVGSVVDGQYLDTRFLYDPVVTNRTLVTLAGGTTNLYKEHLFDPVTKKLIRVQGPGSSSNSWTHGTRYSRDSHGDLVVEEQFDTQVGQTFKAVRDYDAFHNITNQGVGFCSEPVDFWQTQWDSIYRVPLASCDPEGQRVAYAYTNGLVSSTLRFPGPGQTNAESFAYTDYGVLAAATNANGHWVRWSYRGDWQVAAQSNQAGQVMAFQRDARGYVTNITSSAVDGRQSVGFKVDRYGNLLQTCYPDGLSETMQYDPSGKLTNLIDRAGRTMGSTYLPGGRVGSITRMLGSTPVTTRRDYDKQLKALSVSDPMGRVVERYGLDAQQRPIEMTNVDGQTMTLRYGLSRFLRETTRFDGSILRYGYTAAGLLSSLSGPDGIDSFTYWRNGLPKSAGNGTTTLTYGYDGCGTLTNVVDSATGIGLAYRRDPFGHVSQLAWLGRTNHYGYDVAERLATIDAPGTRTTNSYYVYNGLLRSRREARSGLSVDYAFDPLNRVRTIAWRNREGKLLRQFDYGYNCVGLVTHVTTEAGRVTAYGYDGLDRLTNVVATLEGIPIHQRGYRYDLAGNRLAMSTPWGEVTYVTNANRIAEWSFAPSGDEVGAIRVLGYASEEIAPTGSNPAQWVEAAARVTPVAQGTNFTAAVPVRTGQQQLTASIADRAGNLAAATNQIEIGVVTRAEYGYDPAGCATSIVMHGSILTNGTTLGWNGHYQLVCVTTNTGGSGMGGTVVESYQYNANGLRASTTDAGTTRWHVYDPALSGVGASHPIAEVDASGELIRSYVWGAGVDALISFTDYSEQATNTYYTLTDRLGTIHAVADGDGEVVESYDYDAWGRLLAVYDAAGHPQRSDLGAPVSPLGNHYLFQGRWYSYNSGLYYFRARWYDPITGRWASKDPIGIAGGLNQYTFCNNNPVNYRDPSGLVDEALGGARGTRSWLADTLWPSHYARNDLNDEGLRNLGLLGGTGLTANRLRSLGFKPVSAKENIFHTIGRENANNRKWVLDEQGRRYGRLEIIVSECGDQVTDPRVMGTYNYGGSKEEHAGKDVVPYYLFGNSPDDPTTLGQRLWRTTESFRVKE